MKLNSSRGRGIGGAWYDRMIEGERVRRNGGWKMGLLDPELSDNLSCPCILFPFLPRPWDFHRGANFFSHE